MVKKIAVALGLVIVAYLVYTTHPMFQSADTAQGGNGWCHDKNVSGSIETTQPVLSEDGQHFAFAQVIELYQKPVGICTFPDGGWTNMVSREIQIYTSPISNPKLTLVTTQKLSKDSGAMLRIHAWQGDELIIHDWDDAPQGGPVIKTYNMTKQTFSNTGTYAPREDSPNYVAPIYQLPQDKTLHISNRDGLIGLYRETPWPTDPQYDRERAEGNLNLKLETVLIDYPTLDLLAPDIPSVKASRREERIMGLYAQSQAQGNTSVCEKYPDKKDQDECLDLIQFHRERERNLSTPSPSL